MNSSSLQILAGFASSMIFISSNLPMLFKAFKTKDLSSYSLGHLALGNLGKYSILAVCDQSAVWSCLVPASFLFDGQCINALLLFAL